MRGENLLAQVETDFNGPLRNWLGDAQLASDRSLIELCPPRQGLYVAPVEVLEPHWLPDPGSARVPNSVRLGVPILLTARLSELGCVVFNPKDQALRGLLYQS